MVAFESIDLQSYLTVFRADDDVIRRLLEYRRWLVDERCHARIEQTPYSPSRLWRDWQRQSILGFGPGRITLQSGHNFARARSISRRDMVRKALRLRRREPSFHRHYPGYVLSADMEAIEREHPGVFWRTAEAIELCPARRIVRLLEVGAGAGVHVAMRNVAATVIDLPEVVPVAFLFLRSVRPDTSLSLPNEAHDADVKFLLPFQDPGDGFDLAFNMASFQEMEPPVVRAYLALMRERLAPGGIIQSLNAVQGRCGEGGYDFGSMRVDRHATPYHNALGADHICLIAQS